MAGWCLLVSGSFVFLVAGLDAVGLTEPGWFDLALQVALAPGVNGPANLIFRQMSDLGLGGVAASVTLLPFLNCLFWATLIYYGSRAIRARRHPEVES